MRENLLRINDLSVQLPAGSERAFAIQNISLEEEDQPFLVLHLFTFGQNYLRMAIKK